VPTKITFLFDNPADPETLEKAYADGYLDLVRALPGTRRLEAAKVWPKEDGSPTPAYRQVDAYFDDYDAACAAACAAVRTQAAGALFPATFQLGTGGVKILFSDVEVSN
jgi:hypothetical protein